MSFFYFWHYNISISYYIYIYYNIDIDISYPFTPQTASLLVGCSSLTARNIGQIKAWKISVYFAVVSILWIPCKYFKTQNRAKIRGWNHRSFSFTYFVQRWRGLGLDPCLAMVLQRFWKCCCENRARDAVGTCSILQVLSKTINCTLKSQNDKAKLFSCRQYWVCFWWLRAIFLSCIAALHHKKPLSSHFLKQELAVFVHRRPKTNRPWHPWWIP
jgi:hypothetical protein